MHRNIARAYNALWEEHKRIRGVHMKILARGDSRLERRLFQANLDDKCHHNEVLNHEERLPRPQRRRVMKLNAYGRKIEQVMGTLLKF
jgi:hypothetical protein